MKLYGNLNGTNEKPSTQIFTTVKSRHGWVTMQVTWVGDDAGDMGG